MTDNPILENSPGGSRPRLAESRLLSGTCVVKLGSNTAATLPAASFSRFRYLDGAASLDDGVGSETLVHSFYNRWVFHCRPGFAGQRRRPE